MSAEGSAAVERLLLKLGAHDLVPEEEAAALAAAVRGMRDLPAGATLVAEGAAPDASTLLVEGLVARYKALPEGPRQILQIHVPGDLVDLHGFLLKQIDHDVGALTAVRVALVPHAGIRNLTETRPHLARLLWLSTLLDAAIQREKILSVGRRNAQARVAHLLCELYVRLRIVGLASDHRYRLPLTQSDLGEAAGLTGVHVNRMLRKLRNEGLLTFRSGEVVVHDWEGLKRLAGFDPGYLYLERRPR